MRLSSKIRDSLIEALDLVHPAGCDSSLYLFGSRVDDAKKGGDIDLLWILPESRQAWAREHLAEIRSHLRWAAGDQKVDLTLATPAQLVTDPFLLSLGDKILLKTWP